MKKRTFIKLCTAAATMPFELPSFAAPEKLSNWAGNIEYSTDNVATANSLASVQDFVRKHASFKTLGTRHCFNRIADSTQQLLTTDFAAQTPAIDSAARTISVGLGALGVITKVTLNIQPTYQIAQTVYENLSFNSLKEHFDEVLSAAYSVSLFTDWQNQRINEIWLKHRIDPAKPPVKQPQDFFGATRATKNLHPIAALSAENCTEQMGVPGPWYDRLPHFKMGFTPSAGKELQSEYFVPRKNALDAILAVEKLHEQISPHLMITEIRTIAADDLWMSPAYKQDSVAVHFTWKPEWPEVSKLLPVIERELAPFNPRPHWGKLFTIPPAQLQSRHEKLPEFIALAKKFDPQGKFRNDFLNTNIFGAVS